MKYPNQDVRKEAICIANEMIHERKHLGEDHIIAEAAENQK